MKDHHAIIPTGKQPRDLAPALQKVYDAVVTRLIAAFYSACVKEVTSVDGVSNGIVFRARGIAETRDTSVLLLFAHGGPSHLETYDLKPDASDEIRGPYLPIQTNVTGIQVCEHLPKHAQSADRFTLIRSCSHDEAPLPGHRAYVLSERPSRHPC